MSISYRSTSKAGRIPGGFWWTYNSVIVHLFDPEMRAFYRLEELWKNGRVVARIQ